MRVDDGIARQSKAGRQAGVTRDLVDSDEFCFGLRRIE